MPLDPDDPTPEASINRVRLHSGPRANLPPHIEGRTAGDVLSAAAVQDLPPREQAERLAYLIAVLKLGEPAARAARPDWDDSYWRHWSAIGRVYLAGGRAASMPAESVRATLRHLDVACDALVAPHPAFAALIGAARALDTPAGKAFVFDFGGTWIKRGAADYQDGTLTSLRVLESLPVPPRSGSRSPGTLAEIIAASIDALGYDAGATIYVGVSISSYVRDGHILGPQRAGYVAVEGITNLGRWLATEVGMRLGAKVTLRLLHDGTAAALAVSPAPNTAAITLGTFLGIGYARRDAAGLAPISPRFTVLDSG